MRKVLMLAFGVTALAVALFGSYAFASDSVYVGELRVAHIVYCHGQKDAQEIAEAYVNHGVEAADALLVSKRGGDFVVAGVCTARLAKFYVRELVSTHVNGDVKMHVIAVEDFVGGSIFFAVNSTDVVTPPSGVDGKALKLKPERNA